MAYKTKLIISDQNTVESDLKVYLDAEATTIHSINTFTRGVKIYTVIVCE